MTATQIRMRIPAALRDLTGGEAEIVVTVERATVEAGSPDAAGAAGTAGATITTVLDALAPSHPALERRIRDEQGNLRRHVNLFIGADNIRDRNGADTPLRSGDVLAVIPAVSGG